MGVSVFPAASGGGGGESTNLGGPGDFTISLAAGAYKMNNSHTTTLGETDYSAGEHFINAGEEITSASLTGEVAFTEFTPNSSDGDVARSIAYDGTTYIMVGNSGSAYYSTDKLNWTVLTALETVNSGRSQTQIIYANGVWLVGSFSADGQITRSTDGLSWTNHTVVDTNRSAKFITYFRDEYWVTGEHSGTDQLSKSSDGITWTDHVSLSTRPFSIYSDGEDLLVVTLEARKYFFLQPLGAGQGEKTASSNTSFGFTYTFNKTASGVYVISSGSGWVAYSNDPLSTSWTVIQPGSGTLGAVASFKGKVYLAGNGDQIISSADGATWTVEVDNGVEYYGLSAIGNDSLFATSQFNETKNLIIADKPDSSLAIISTLGEVTQPNA